jgi:hypothetical protein
MYHHPHGGPSRLGCVTVMRLVVQEKNPEEMAKEDGEKKQAQSDLLKVSTMDPHIGAFFIFYSLLPLTKSESDHSSV